MMVDIEWTTLSWRIPKNIMPTAGYLGGRSTTTPRVDPELRKDGCQCRRNRFNRRTKIRVRRSILTERILSERATALALLGISLLGCWGRFRLWGMEARGSGLYPWVWGFS